MTLPLFWWLTPQKFEHQPIGYEHPFLMTLSAILWRLRGRNAHWIAARRSKPTDRACIVGGWSSYARVMIGAAEAPCVFPRWVILLECAFWRSWMVAPLRGVR
jgi:hypothetical protein